MAETRIVLSDASPLIALAAAGVFDLLHRLFDSVTVTASVRREVLTGKGRPDERELREAIRRGWILVRRDHRVGSALADLDHGEATTLATAAALGSRCLALVDDPLARHRARALGISITGTGGVLLIAKKRGLIAAVRPPLEAMMRANFRLSAEVVVTLLEDAGEARNDESKSQ